MAKEPITKDEWTMIANAIANEIKSAKRAQTAGKTPHIKAVYEQHEKILLQLQAKVLSQ